MFVIPVIIACVISDPQVCATFDGPYMSQTQCITSDQQLRASFEQAFPELRVKSLKCEKTINRNEA